MSLDVTLVDQTGSELFSLNITHNLTAMADAAGIYECLWRPNENGITHARQIIGPLTTGLERLEADQRKFEAFDASNGWGRWKHFVAFCRDYLKACQAYPDALVEVSR